MLFGFFDWILDVIEMGTREGESVRLKRRIGKVSFMFWSEM